MPFDSRTQSKRRIALGATVGLSFAVVLTVLLAAFAWIAVSLDTIADQIVVGVDGVERTARDLFWFVLIAGSVASILVAWTGAYLRQILVNRLRDVGTGLVGSAQQVTSTSLQIAASSQQLAKGTESEAASLHETAAAFEQIANIARRSADHASDVHSLATDVRHAAEGSRDHMSRMNEAIQRIKDSSDETARVIRTIDDIAFQTNLLALNAAVEAARAGDAGRGFAVVADEVGQLAHRSAESARTTAELIEQAQNAAASGVRVAEEVAAVLEQIVSGILEVSDVIGQISVASSEQAQGVEQVNQSIAMLERSTQQNAGTAQQFAASSQHLSAQARELRGHTEAWLNEVDPRSAQASEGVLLHSREVAPTRAPEPVASTRGPAPRPAPAKSSAAIVSPSPVRRAPEAVIPLDEDDLAEF